MVLSDTVAAIQGVVDLAYIIQQTGAGWYGTAAAYKTFKQNITKIENAMRSWESLVVKYGLSSEEALENRLKEAKKLLEEEKARLERRHGSYTRWCLFRCQLILNWTTFPTTLSESIESLTNTILADWKEDEARELAAEARAKEQARLKTWQDFPFKADDRYVRLPIIEQDIESALKEQSVRAVLLVGRAGTGKTCMARHLALKYQEETNRAPMSEVSAITSSIPEITTSRAGGDRSSVFDEVLFLECGPAADLAQKQKELMKGLGWRESLEELKDVEGDPKRHLMGILRLLLKQRRVLIIFDDIWEDQFLEDMVSVAGSRVKIIVTAQRLGLCFQGGPKFAHISMDRITEVDAQQILRAHAGFRQQDNISESIQECMATLVKESFTNPHILASMATTIAHGRRNELVEWETLILGQEEVRRNLGESSIKIQGMKYSTSMGIKFLRLNPGEMNLMILMSILKGPSVPECVIQLLSSDSLLREDARNQKSRLSPLFSTFRQNLEDLQCVEVTNVDGQYFWAIHFLDREFLLQTRADDVKGMVEKFCTLSKKRQGLEQHPQEHLLKLMAILHFKSEWAVKLVTGLSLPLQDMVRARGALCDVLILMMRNTLHDWSSSERDAADQVFLSYMWRHEFHVDALKILLHCRISKQLMLDAVIKIVKISDVSLSESLVMDMLSETCKGELTFTEENHNVLKLNIEQCNLLYSLASREGNLDGHLVRWSLCRRQIVSGLIEIFKSKSNDLDLRGKAIGTVGYLGRGFSFPQSEDRVVFLVKFPMLLRELACVLEDKKHPKLQFCAVWALFQFANSAKEYGEVKLNISETTGQQLVESLGNRDDMTLLHWTMWSLKELVSGGRQVSLKILSYPHAIDAILTIIGSQNIHEDFSEVRWGAMWALLYILRAIFPSSETGSEMKVIQERVRTCLLQLLCEDHPVARSANVEDGAVFALTWIDPVTARGLPLVSARAFRVRAWSLVQLGNYKDALSDLNKADQLFGGKDSYTCMLLMQANAKLEKWDAAVEYGNRAVANASHGNLSDALQERGVLKRMMKNLKGALIDLEDALKHDPQDYERLKQRAYVKYLLGDEDGARKDAEEVLHLRPSWYDRPLVDFESLGTSSVHFLNFQL